MDDPRVRAPWTDRPPRWWTLAAVGAGAMMTGMLLARATMQPAGSDASLDAIDAVPVAAPDGAPRTDDSPMPLASNVPGDDAPSAGMGRAGDEREASTEQTARGPSIPRSSQAVPVQADRAPFVVRPGRVAYLRCTEPCPRDTAFERALLDAVGGLASCATVRAHAGSGDLRVVVEHGVARDLYFGPGTDLPREPLLGCLRPVVIGRAVQPRVQGVVSVRFSLETTASSANSSPVRGSGLGT
ncbi:MAG: hypothetical protein NZ898_15030 [Myxococcota bacterium]|nr:hypothetical protein [Myxococcota bacterium]MDW8360942.1 hypothetical protein [Myxococcales bacterium]